jgi:hypothetical protein
VAAHVIVFASPWLYLLILVASYAQQFAFAAILSVLFDRKQTATAIAGLVNVLCAMLAAALQTWLPGEAKLIWYLAGLIPYTNVFNGLSSMMWLEVSHFMKCQISKVS